MVKSEYNSVHEVQQATAALNLLAKIMVNILDIIYDSAEKEKVSVFEN